MASILWAENKGGEEEEKYKANETNEEGSEDGLENFKFLTLETEMIRRSVLTHKKICACVRKT